MGGGAERRVIENEGKESFGFFKAAISPAGTSTWMKEQTNGCCVWLVQTNKLETSTVISPPPPPI